MAAIATNFGYVFESAIIHQSGRSYFKDQNRLVSIEPNDLTLGGVEGNLLHVTITYPRSLFFPTT